MSGIAIAATIVIGGATIFFSEGTVTPAVISIAESIGVGSAAGALTAGIASEYEWGYAYSQGYVTYEECMDGIKTALVGNVLSLVGLKANSIASKIGVSETIRIILEKVIGHAGDGWTIFNYKE